MASLVTKNSNGYVTITIPPDVARVLFPNEVDEYDITELINSVAEIREEIDALDFKVTNGVGLTSFTFENLEPIPANSYKVFTETVTKEGFAPLGIGGFQIAGSKDCWLLESRINQSGVVTVRVKNNSNSEVTLTSLLVYILWRTL